MFFQLASWVLYTQCGRGNVHRGLPKPSCKPSLTNQSSMNGEFLLASPTAEPRTKPHLVPADWTRSRACQDLTDGATQQSPLTLPYCLGTAQLSNLPERQWSDTSLDPSDHSGFIQSRGTAISGKPSPRSRGQATHNAGCLGQRIASPESQGEVSGVEG